MNPIICFYKDDQSIFSSSYNRLDCADDVSVIDFLKNIEESYPNEMKIVQINFEFEFQKIFTAQTQLYPAAKATVFILKKFDFFNWNESISKLNFSRIKESLRFTPKVEKKEFIEKTIAIVNEIKKGRIYQANLTAALVCKTKEKSEDLFAHFQNYFRGQYKAFLPLKTVNVLSFSPELFLRQENQVLRTMPIKGSLDQNKDFASELIQNTKEDAELSMIVDLLRNDLNSISEKFSSKVILHRQRMQLGYIQHTYSEIEVRSESNLCHVLEKTFPGGSISGCPKKESLKVIQEVESIKRQVYTGSIGWWQGNDFCLSIAIRSFIHHEDNLFYHAGCGIVHDSNPEAEWNEFLLKTGTLNVK